MPGFLKRCLSWLLSPTGAALVAVVLLLELAPLGFAQRDEMQKLAARAADRLQPAGKKRVVVADFAGPADSMTELGRVLAGDFSSALALASKDVDVLDPARLNDLLRARRQTPLSLRDPKVAAEMGAQFGAEAVITGQLEDVGATVSLNLKLLDVSAGAWLDTFSAALPKTEPVARLLAQQLYRLPPPAPPGPHMVDGAYLPGRGGVGTPKCLSCPSPPYSEKARKEKISGVVMLELVVTPEGRTKNIKVVRGVGYGLDEQAVNAVKDWTFVPADGPDGKPVPVRVNLEVTFKVR